MEDDLYDEFGNLIGDPLDSDAESLDEEVQSISEEQIHPPSSLTPETGLALVRTYGPGTETIVVKPNNVADEQPVIQPEIVKKLKVEFSDDKVDQNSALPTVTYSRDYMLTTMKQNPQRIRNVAITGNLHSGKTSFVDMLVRETHPSLVSATNIKDFRPLRYLDNHKLEIARGVTIKTSPLTLLLPDSKDRSHVLNIVDSPGHPNFFDETSTAIRAADGVVLVVDALEGLTAGDRAVISETLLYNLPLVVVLNKIDRLMLELKLPISDCYYKLRYTLDDINAYISDSEYVAGYSHTTSFSPELNNVVFASARLEFSFSLQSFTDLYFQDNGVDTIDHEKFATMLWGDVFVDSANKFTKTSNNGANTRSFERYILEPVYKLATYTLTSDSTGKKLANLLWDNFGVTLHKSQYKQDSQILLRDVFKSVFHGSKGFVEVIKSQISSPEEALPNKAQSLLGVDTFPDGLAAHAIKLLDSADASRFYSLVRVYQGILKIGSKVKVLGDNHSNDPEDFKIETIEELYISGGKYRIPVTEVTAGCIAIVGGIETINTKGASIFEASSGESLRLFKGLNYGEKSVFKVSIEPEKPAELPKLLEGLRKLSRSYLALVVKVEESGEHVLLAPGELYLDCALHDLRNFYTDDLAIKVSDPVSKFSETCVETSVTRIPIKSHTNKNSISVIAEPLGDDKLSFAIENGQIDLSQPVKTTSKILRKDFGWDSLAARSLWAFGPNDRLYPSILMDDTLEAETDKALLYSVKDFINTGFLLAVNEGPLCEEPIRNAKFKILDVVLNGADIQRNSSQMIPVARNACHAGFLTAAPRLLEPLYNVFVTCTSIAIPAISKLLGRRRGEVTRKAPIPGTQLFLVEGYVPAIESVGLETDVRLQTQGQAMCLLQFDRWEYVPGDPLDKDCELPPLRPVPYKSLARDFVIKTRKRKGLSDEPTLQKYLEPELYSKLVERGVIS